MAFVIDQPNCSCCHQCKVACPVGAIRFKNRKYWIDPDKCVSCGVCAKHCHNGVISNPDAPVVEPEKHDRISRQCDLLVLGAGGTGLAAACAARDSCIGAAGGRGVPEPDHVRIRG